MRSISSNTILKMVVKACESDQIKSHDLMKIALDIERKKSIELSILVDKICDSISKPKKCKVINIDGTVIR